MCTLSSPFFTFLKRTNIVFIATFNIQKQQQNYNSLRHYHEKYIHKINSGDVLHYYHEKYIHKINSEDVYHLMQLSF